MADNAGKRASGKRSRKRRFHGNQFTRTDKLTVSNELNNGFSISSPKHVIISETIAPHSNSFLENSELNTSASCKKLNVTDTDFSSESSRFDGNMIVDKNILYSFLEENTVCKLCHSKLKFSTKRSAGLCSKIILTCQGCKNVVMASNTKLVGEKRNIAEINRRIIYAMRCIGQGLEPLKTFCGVMDLDPPVMQKTYDKICKLINNAAKVTAIESMKNATAEEVSSCNSTDITVSGDGTWKTRGHTSQIGVCTVIGAESGKVIDVEVLSIACKGCELWKSPRSGKAFDEWQKTHSRTCLRNHFGSSAKMEADGMVKIFQRSQSARGVRYVNYIGDGDSKTFLSITESKPYKGVVISKLECVGHIQKRMGTRLRKLKADYKGRKLSDGKSLSGKGRLTDSAISRLSLYYGNAIRQHADSLKDMRNAIWALYFHTRSTDSEPLHHFCPTGESSWCKYQVASAKGVLKDFRHKETLPLAVMDVIKPIFNSLSHPDLLKRCLGAHTQNPNESLNSMIWQICPKTSGSGRIISEIAVHEAVTLFNDGRKGRLSTMRHLNIHPGINCITAQFRSDYRRVTSSKKRAIACTVDARRAKRHAKMHEIKKNYKTEGVTYLSGAF